MKLRKPVRFLFLLFMLSVFILEFPGVSDLVRSPYSGIQTKNLVVQNVDAQGPNAGSSIEYGDEIYSVDGVRVRNYNHYRYILKRNETFASQKYVFIRDGNAVTATVRYVSIPAQVVTKRFNYLLVAFMFLLMGVFVFLKKGDLVGTLFSLNCTFLAFFLTDRPALGSASLQLLGELFHDMVILIFPAVFLHFFMVFPERSPAGPRHGHSYRVPKIYLVPTVLFAFDAYLVLKHFFQSSANSVLVKALLGASTAYMAAYMVASLFIFVRAYRSSSRALKARLRIIIFGTTAGTIPFLITVILRQLVPGVSNWWDMFAAVALGLIAVSFAYAILKHGAIELNVVVKKSLVYAMLTGGIVAIYYALVNVLGNYLTREFSLSSSVFSIVSVLIIAVVFAPARNLLQRVVDRVFYVGDYVYKQEVGEFNKSLSGKLSEADIMDAFFDRVTHLMQSSYVAVYMVQDGNLRLRNRCGSSADLPEELPSGAVIADYLSFSTRSLMIEYLDPGWLDNNLDVASRDFIEDSGAMVVLRLASQETFMGLVVLGPKKSGLPYKRTDVDLLETFCEHLGLVLENAALHEETLKQERLRNEVMLARDIQLSLLPESPPYSECFEIVGSMKSSSEVGGDYFDYFPLDERRIAVAIGDASGKGIPAAMLIFSLQAVFKNLALKERLSPGEVVSALNDYMVRNAKQGQFASFFYGILDMGKFTFSFSNAGNHPAFLVKKGYADRLGEGGTLLGVEAEHTYEEGSVRLEPGDLLCLYTDGVVERKDDTGQEFAHSGLVDLLLQHGDLPPQRIIELLFARVLAFGQSEQEDDLTCVIIKYKKA